MPVAAEEAAVDDEDAGAAGSLPPLAPGAAGSLPPLAPCAFPPLLAEVDMLCFLGSNGSKGGGASAAAAAPLSSPSLLDELAVVLPPLPLPSAELAAVEAALVLVLSDAAAMAAPSLRLAATSRVAGHTRGIERAITVYDGFAIR